LTEALHHWIGLVRSARNRPDSETQARLSIARNALCSRSEKALQERERQGQSSHLFAGRYCHRRANGVVQLAYKQEGSGKHLCGGEHGRREGDRKA